MATVESKKERLLGLENHLLSKLMDVRYALESYSGPVKQADLTSIRINAGKFIELAEEIQKQQDREYEEKRKEEYGDD